MKFIVALNKIYLGHMDSSSMDVLWNIPGYGCPQGISTKANKTGTYWVPLCATWILAFLEWLWGVKGQGIPAIQAVSEKKQYHQPYQWINLVGGGIMHVYLRCLVCDPWRANFWWNIYSHTEPSLWHKKKKTGLKSSQIVDWAESWQINDTGLT